MNISKADALAFLGKWFKAQTEVQAVYKAVTGNVMVTGKIEQLNPSAIKIVGTGSDMLLFFQETSEYDYKDARASATDADARPLNKYPPFIEVKFRNGDRVEISECFQP
jgi:hypothetical protein